MSFRVVMLSKACLVGSYQKKLEELARFPDIELTVIVPPSWRDERGVTHLERAHTDGYRLIVAPIALNGRFHLHFYPTLGKLLCQTRPDIVHIDEEPYNLATFQAMWLARRGGARTLFFTWQNLLRRYPPPFRWWEQYNLGRADYALAGNREAIGVLRTKGYRGAVKVIPQFGVDPAIFTMNAVENSRSEFHIGYLGRLVKEKGVDLLLHAAAKIKSERAWHVDILGSGPERADLEKLSAELGLAGRVTFHSYVSSTEVVKFYHQLDAVVLPSRTRPNWKEQFGRVIIEGMACGVPVIGAMSGEIPNVIGDAGLLFLEDDADALTEGLTELMSDAELWQRLRQAGRKRVLAHYTQERVAAETCEVYREMLAK